MYGTPGVYRFAENPRASTKASIKRASKAARRNMRSLDKEALKQLEQVYQQAVDDIRQYLVSRAGDDNTIRLDVMRSLLDQAEARLNTLAAQRNDLLESGLLQAAGYGVEPMYAAAGVGTNLSSVAHEAVQFVTSFVAEDGLQLSDRIWAIDNHAKEVVSNSIQRAVVQGHSASQAAQEFLARGANIPPEIARKMNAAQWDKIYREIKSGVLTGDGSAYANARRLFRTEINRAHGEAYQASVLEHPDVIGTRFLLSPNHPKTDICDMHARVNRYGLGPGVYPEGKNPWPAHPNTLSFVEAVFADEVTAEDRKGKENRIDWLNNQPAGVQYGVLGSSKKVAALDRGLMKEGHIATPWKVLKKKYARKGYDTDSWVGGTAKPLPEVELFQPVAPRQGFEPAKTPRAAAKWAMDNDLADYADYAGSSVEVANAWNRSVFEHVGEFPEIRKNLKFIGTVQARNKRWRAIAIEEYISQLKARNLGWTDARFRRYAERNLKRPRTPGNVWAYSSGDQWVQGVSVNSKWAKAVDDFKAALIRNVESGFHPVGGDTIKSVIDHELGHQLDDMLLIRDEIRVKNLFNKWRMGNTQGEGLSVYGRKNIAEFIAESWAEYRNADSPRDIAREIGQLIQTRYREQFSG